MYPKDFSTHVQKNLKSSDPNTNMFGFQEEAGELSALFYKMNRGKKVDSLDVLDEAGDALYYLDATVSTTSGGKFGLHEMTVYNFLKLSYRNGFENKVEFRHYRLGETIEDSELFNGTTTKDLWCPEAWPKMCCVVFVFDDKGSRVGNVSMGHYMEFSDHIRKKELFRKLKKPLK